MPLLPPTHPPAPGILMGGLADSLPTVRARLIKNGIKLVEVRGTPRDGASGG